MAGPLVGTLETPDLPRSRRVAMLIDVVAASLDFIVQIADATCMLRMRHLL